MQPDYVTVVDPLAIIPTALAMIIHSSIAFLQAGLAVLLIGSGAAAARRPGIDSVWLRRIGGTPSSRLPAVLRIGLGVLLLLPTLAGTPSAISILAGVAAFAVILLSERTLPAGVARSGRRMRRAALGAAALVVLFSVWEGEDSLALWLGLTTNMSEWRAQEIEWQLRNDATAPKVGDAAPDFELQDPKGVTTVRLSDFRGKRPVVLVFGSYT